MLLTLADTNLTLHYPTVRCGCLMQEASDSPIADIVLMVGGTHTPPKKQESYVSKAIKQPNSCEMAQQDWHISQIDHRSFSSSPRLQCVSADVSAMTQHGKLMVYIVSHINYQNRVRPWWIHGQTSYSKFQLSLWRTSYLANRHMSKHMLIVGINALPYSLHMPTMYI